MDHSDQTKERERSRKESCSKKAICEGIGTRHVLVILGFLGFTSVYAMRVNLSVAIVAMVNSTSRNVIDNNQTFLNDTEHCPFPDNHDPDESMYKNGEFNWDTNTQGLILGAFFYGYALSNIPCGMAAEKWGGRWVNGLGIIFTAIFTILSPMAARISTNLFVVTRVLEGMAEGATFPAMSFLIARWFPKNERSKYTGMIYSGIQFGTVITMPISGWLCASSFLGGWPSVFYVFGFLGIVVGVLWIWLIRDSPLQHPNISVEEVKYIIQGSGETEKKIPIPWLSFFTSKYFWVIAIMHFGNNWGFYTLLTELPTYLDNILHINIKNNGTISALPYLGSWLFCIGFSVITGHLVTHKGLSILSVRRFAMAFAAYGPMLALIGMCFVKCRTVLAIGILVLGGTLNGSAHCGTLSSHADISPRFSGTLMGITNSIGTIPGFVVPALTGILTKENQTISAWESVFLIAAIIYGITATIYIIFFRTEIQPWNDPKDKEVSEPDYNSINMKSLPSHVRDTHTR